LICLLFAIILISCNVGSEDIIPNVEIQPQELNAINLSSSVNFKNLLEAQEILISKFGVKVDKLSENEREKTVNEIEILIDKGASDYKSVREVALLMGFESVEEYSDINKKIVSSSNALNKEFSLSSKDVKNLTEITISAIQKLNKKNIEGNNKVTSCGALRNCEQVATAVLLVTSTGCASSVFLPVVGPFIGVACEASAIYLHYKSVQKCGYDNQC
jgi:hypothetical protein